MKEVELGISMGNTCSKTGVKCVRQTQDSSKGKWCNLPLKG